MDIEISNNFKRLVIGMKTAAIAAVLLPLSFTVAFAETLYEQAEQQVQAGDITGMAATYLEILQKNPEDMKAHRGYATANSWLGNHNLAQRHFWIVLENEPDNLEAMSGLGYDYAWAGQYSDAESIFTTAQSYAPDNIGIQKGLAYTYLWGNQPDKSLHILDRLVKKAPDDVEVHAARGQALAALAEDEAAKAAFETALSIDPGREDAINGLKALQQGRHVFDVGAWYGNTSDGGDSGLREFSVAYRLKNDARIWFRFDDSLSLDNPALARSGESAETIYLGYQSRGGSNWLNIVEIGNRDLPDNADQQIYKFEAVNLRSSKKYKIGLQLSPHSEDYTDKLIYTGLSYSLNESWQLNPTLFLSSSGAIDDKEVRAVVYAETRPTDRLLLGLGAGLGRISSDVSTFEGSVSTANLMLSYSLNQKTALSLAARYEDSPANSFSTVLVGVNIQLP